MSETVRLSENLALDYAEAATRRAQEWASLADSYGRKIGQASGLLKYYLANSYSYDEQVITLAKELMAILCIPITTDISSQETTHG